MCHQAQPSALARNMIIVSRPSAEATQPVSTGRYTPARRRSSAARNDTPRCADAQPISVHTEVLEGVAVSLHVSGLSYAVSPPPLMTPLPLMTLSMNAEAGRLWGTGVKVSPRTSPHQGG